MLRDSTGTIQCVGKFDVLGEETFADLKAILIETSVIFRGKVVTSDDAPGGHELRILSVEIIGHVNSERPFPITESTLKVVDEEGSPLYGGSEFLLNHRHLYLRVGRQTTMLKLRSSAFGAIHNYFRGHEFIEYQAQTSLQEPSREVLPCSKSLISKMMITPSKKCT